MSIGQIRSNAFSIVEPLGSTPVDINPSMRPGCIVKIGNNFDLHRCNPFLATEDPYVYRFASGGENYLPTWRLKPLNRNFGIDVTASWTGGKNAPANWEKLYAYHYNDPRLGATGFGSLDIVTAPKNNPVRVDDTAEGQIRWNITLRKFNGSTGTTR